ncbi:helix-turn-helix domain-containing protein [Kitasatospora sp. NPDC058965]|uniref:AraC-like ligand-binding domain-containing protein n=1 Tax=Kitasatospora sp. NPDC058965 TaxID=3346682 RepID=UPI00369D7068
MRTVFRADRVPADERFDAWHQLVSGCLVPSVNRTPDPAGFAAELRVAELGRGILLTDHAYSPLRAQRTAALVRRSDPEELHLVLAREGRQRLEQGDRQVLAGPGEAVLYDTSQPSTYQGSAHQGQPLRELVLQVPRALLPADGAGLRPLAATALPVDAGPGALLSRLLDQVAARPSGYSAAECTRLGAVVLDLLALALERRLAADPAARPETHRAALLQQVKEYIRQHLADPRLSPADIAAGCHLSVRYLHRLFEQEESTVTAWIRDLRLQAAHRDLGAAAHQHLPIHRIAARWGFPHASAFTRAYRAAYGTSPSEARRAEWSRAEPGGAGPSVTRDWRAGGPAGSGRCEDVEP